MIREDSPLLTDLYELTMLQAYLAEGMLDTAVFELFVRKLPARRNFLVAAGLETLLDWLEGLHFTPAEVDALAADGRFNDDLLQYLATLHFAGDVDAMPEGTIFFPDEPVVRVTAPMPQAQFIETRLINFIQFQTLIASKAARSVLAADGRLLIDFGLRRAHGTQAGLHAARAAYIAGFAGTSTVAAKSEYGIPVFGTMAHSYVQAHAQEADAFAQFARSHPRGLTLLIDTYDTQAAARKVVALAPQLRADLRSVRIDSGDLGEEARRVRTILDAGGLRHVQIFASGGIDEDAIATLVAGSAPIDGYGVGTALVTSSDAPNLDCAYKLEAYANQPRRKRSQGKATWPGAKQVYRRHAADGTLERDVVTLIDGPAAGAPLLIPVMRGGRRLGGREPIEALRTRCARELAALPAALRRLTPAAEPFHADISPELRALAGRLDRDSH